MTRIEFLEEMKEFSMNNIRCYSDSLLQNQPNERFRKEWTREQERIKVIDEMLEEEKTKLQEQNNNMRFKQFNFIDENFGEETENALIWNDNSFILISAFDNEITIKEYEDVLDLFKEFITNRNELMFLRDLAHDQEKEIGDLEAKLNEKEKNDNI
ncbi:MAG: hypothetical protein K6B70_03215 [Clostridia bacterium]|nr:hypothetical protein [Clostridia bacterium]